MVLGNKEKTAKKSVIDISGTDTKYKSAVVYAVTQADSGIRVVSVDNDIKDNKIEVELPELSMAAVVLSDKASDVKVYEAPNIEEKKVEFKFDELELSVNKAPMIPIEDKEHLKKIIINCTASSSTGSSWFCGGGGLCFNQVVKSDGTLAGWGSKSFSYNGTGDCIVEMDGTFTIPDPTKDGASIELENADYKDTYIEFQDWWKSSANSEKGEDVSVTYNTITMVYEYDHTGEPKVTTTTTASTTSSATTTTTTASVSSSTSGVQAKLIGDANLDNNVTVADAVAILQFIGNKDKYALSDEAKANADCFNPGDGITGMDAIAIQKLDAKLISALPEINK